MSARALLPAIAAGGGLGALARYGLGLGASAAWPETFALGTLIANGLGSFLIGLIAIWSVRRFPPPVLNGFLVTGFCGGFTTFSIFSLESLMLALAGHWRAAAVYIASSVIIWLGAVWLGWRAGGALFSAR